MKINFKTLASLGGLEILGNTPDPSMADLLIEGAEYIKAELTLKNSRWSQN